MALENRQVPTKQFATLIYGSHNPKKARTCQSNFITVVINNNNNNLFYKLRIHLFKQNNTVKIHNRVTNQMWLKSQFNTFVAYTCLQLSLLLKLVKVIKTSQIK